MLFATLGMLMMVSANDLISLYLGLELQSLSLYVIAAFRRDTVRSSEAGLKYFVLGALSRACCSTAAPWSTASPAATGLPGLAEVLRANLSGEAPSVGLVIGLVFVVAGSPSRSRPCRSTCGRRTSTRARRRRSRPSSPARPRWPPWRSSSGS